MSSVNRDQVVAQAVRSVEPPPPRPGFWAELDEALRADRAAASAAGEPPEQPEAAVGEASVGEVAVVVPLAPVARRWRRYQALVAAAAVAAAALTTTVLVDRDSDQRVQTAPADEGVAPSPSTATEAPPTGEVSAKTGRGTPDQAVVAWLDALGAGDVETAAGLVGRRTEQYYESLGADLTGVMVESQEGTGGWAGSVDRSTTEVDLGVVDGVELSVVVVSGTWTGEGEDGFRTDAIPVARSGQGGTWLVEPAAFDAQQGGRLELRQPAPGDAGLAGLAPDATIEAAAPGSGRFWFSLDDEAPEAVEGRPDGAGVHARWDPPGAMASQSHLLVVAYVDGATFTAFAGVFTVEG